MRKSMLFAVTAVTLASASMASLEAQSNSRRRGNGPANGCSTPSAAHNPHCAGVRPPVEVPEPASVGLLLAGLGALGFAAHRRRSA